MTNTANGPLRRSEIAKTLTERGDAIYEAHKQGVPTSHLGKRFSVADATLRAYLRKRAATDAGEGLEVDVDVDDDGQEDNAERMVRILGLPRRLPNIQSPRLEGDPMLPGYEAWRMHHHARVSIKDCVRRLGLRYPSEMFSLLEQHKKLMEDKRLASAIERGRAGKNPVVAM